MFDRPAPDGRGEQTAYFLKEGVLGIAGLYGHSTRTVSIEGETYEVDYEMESVSLRIHAEGDTLVRIPLAAAIDSTYARTTAGQPPHEMEPLTVEVENERLAVLVVIEQMNGTRRDEGIEVNNFGGLFFVRFKK